MFTLKIVLLLIAAICFGLKAANANIANIDLQALGFMFVVLAFVV